MYSLRQIYRGIKHPDKVAYKIERFCHTRGGQYTQNPRGTNHLDEDWDNLIILDACRHDFFAKCSELPGELEYRYSLGSHTRQFVRETFRNRTMHDTVYIMSNNWFLKLKDDIGAEVYHFLDFQQGDHDVEWVDKGRNVVTPETVTRHARRVHNQFPHKRLIIHYMQPHHPFTGPTGKEYLSHKSTSLSEVVRHSGPEVDKEIIRKAYVETLEHVLTAVEDLLPHLKGKTVVTADHGEMLGERLSYVPVRGYGHPIGFYNEYTTKIPWNVIETGERKEIVEEQSVREHEVDMQTVNDQLRSLGYKV